MLQTLSCIVLLSISHRGLYWPSNVVTEQLALSQLYDQVCEWWVAVFKVEWTTSMGVTHNSQVCRCPMGTTLLGSSQTGHWGYWYDLLEPALVIGNDTVIDVEMPTFAAGQACKCCTKCIPSACSWAAKTPQIVSLLATMQLLLYNSQYTICNCHVLHQLWDQHCCQVQRMSNLE